MIHILRLSYKITAVESSQQKRRKVLFLLKERAGSTSTDRVRNGETEERKENAMDVGSVARTLDLSNEPTSVGNEQSMDINTGSSDAPLWVERDSLADANRLGQRTERLRSRKTVAAGHACFLLAPV